MTALEDITQFAEEVRKGSPAVRTEVMTFPSGVIMLDVHCGERLFVMAYFPRDGFGVDEVLEGEGFGTGYRYGFPDFPSARDKLLQLMNAPLNGAPN
jgi:hypothetical protein